MTLYFTLDWTQLTANMFSTTFYKDLALWLRFSKCFYILPFTFDTNKRILKHKKSFEVTFTTNFLSVIIILWYTIVTAQNFVLYRQQNLDGLNLGLVFQIGATVLILVSTITAFFSEDICTIVNGLTMFFRQLHCTLNYSNI